MPPDQVASDTLVSFRQRLQGAGQEALALLPFFGLVWILADSEFFSFDRALTSGSAAWIPLSLLAAALIYLAYGAYHETGRRQAGQRLAGPDHQPAGFGRRLLRYLLKYGLLIAAVPVLFPEWLAGRLDGRVDYPLWSLYLAALLTLAAWNLAGSLGWLPIFRRGQSLSDQLAGTYLIRTQGQKSPRSLALVWGVTAVLAFVAFSLPYLIAVEERAKLSSTYANMHTLQTIVETYAVDWNGAYPPNLKTLERAAQKGDYWKEVPNPYNGKTGLGPELSYSDSGPVAITQRHILFIALPVSHCPQAQGVVLYVPAPPPARGYVIYGCGKEHQLLQKRGEVRLLTQAR